MALINQAGGLGRADKTPFYTGFHTSASVSWSVGEGQATKYITFTVSEAEIAAPTTLFRLLRSTSSNTWTATIEIQYNGQKVLSFDYTKASDGGSNVPVPVYENSFQFPYNLKYRDTVRFAVSMDNTSGTAGATFTGSIGMTGMSI